ncbi:SGNH/GDSL hydrolase family protein [Empedobacter brevis]|uniref:SGNH/GDSL hydrolase family protein n=1 Tax=Empedobacter brevis TaxID=247 RepID=UPI0028AC4376|nr:SGNH/GDSL hydrolase family protein [Empedobacter brevis]
MTLNELKSYINQMIYENNERRISGTVLNEILKQIIDITQQEINEQILENNTQVQLEPIIPSSPAPIIDSGIWIITEPGEYLNFGNVELLPNNIGFILKNNNIFSLETIELPIQDIEPIQNKVNSNEQKLDSLINFIRVLNVTGDKVTGSYINSTGVAVNSVNWECSKPIQVDYLGNYYYEGRTTLENGADSAAQAVVAFNKNGTFHSIIKGSYNSLLSGKFNFIIDDVNIGSVKLSSRQGFGLGIFKKYDEIPKERVEGLIEIDEKIKTLESGVSDLTGITSLAYLNSSGVAVNISTWKCSDFIKKDDNNQEYFYEGKTNLGSSTAFAIVGYNENKEKVSDILYQYDSSTAGPFSFKISDSTIKYFRACSHGSVPLNVYVKTNKIPMERVEGLIELKETVKDIVENTGSGPINSTKSWAAIGDSITAFDNTQKGYQSFVKEKIIFTSYSNQGYSGRSLTNASDRASILEGIANIGAFDIYTILVGTNDFRLDRPIGTVDDYINNTGPTTFYGALRGTIDLLYSKRQSSKIYIFSPLRRNNAGYTSFSTNNAGHKLIDYRDALEWVTKHEALTFLDLYNDSGITDRNLSLYTSDGLHPNVTGHEIISKIMIEEFKTRI